MRFRRRAFLPASTIPRRTPGLRFSRQHPSEASMTLRSCVRGVLVVLALSTAPGYLASAGQAAISTGAKDAPLGSAVPTDPRITVATLPNGLRYYIRANKAPRNRAELRLVVKAGSVLEDENQRGLAHFVEHMAF